MEKKYIINNKNVKLNNDWKIKQSIGSFTQIEKKKKKSDALFI